MLLRFEWDPEKAASNLKKHGVSFDEAAAAFRDPFAAIFDDDAHSDVEPRQILVGHAVTGRLLLVSFTERADTVVRIISARSASRREKKAHEER